MFDQRKETNNAVIEGPVKCVQSSLMTHLDSLHYRCRKRFQRAVQKFKKRAGKG